MAYAASLLGVRNPVFLSAPVPALVWVTVANIWRGTAFSMIMQYAGMKTVPPELYEAATVDGAGALQKFRHITLPSLRGILLINLVLITIATLNTFDMVLPLTGGGPGRATEVIALYIYHLVFSEFQFGRGSRGRRHADGDRARVVRLLRAHAAKGTGGVTDQNPQKANQNPELPLPSREGAGERARVVPRHTGSIAIYAGYIVVGRGLPVPTALGRFSVTPPNGGAVRLPAASGPAASNIRAPIATC